MGQEELQNVIIQPFLVYSQGINDLDSKQITALCAAFFVTVFDRPVYTISPPGDRRKNVQQRRHRNGKPVFNLMRVSSSSLFFGMPFRIRTHALSCPLRLAFSLVLNITSFIFKDRSS